MYNNFGDFMDIVFASNNKHKISEYKSIITNYNILTLNDVGFTEDIIEDGKDFYENALIKAKTVYEFLKSKGLDYIVIAEDGGLCVDALNGEPGIYSARYSGVHGDDSANRKKLLSKLEGLDRSSYFMCVIAMIKDDNISYYTGKTYGSIVLEETGDTSFGYDCLFYSSDLNKVFGLCTREEKNSVSHRGRAIKEMVKDLC